MIARALRDAGCEVIYSGLHRTPAQIVAMALEEDVDAIGLSTLSGAHLTLFPLVMDELRAANVEDVVVFGGGVIPSADVDILLQAGLARIFTPGSALADIALWVKTNVPER